MVWDDFGSQGLGLWSMGAWTWLKQRRSKHGWSKRRYATRWSGLGCGDTDCHRVGLAFGYRRSRVRNWEGQERVSSDTEVVKSLQMRKAPFWKAPDAASKGVDLTAWGGHSVTLETLALTPSLPLARCVYHSVFLADYGLEASQWGQRCHHPDCGHCNLHKM